MTRPETDKVVVVLLEKVQVISEVKPGRRISKPPVDQIGPGVRAGEINNFS